jgi:hypothetical protein
MLEEKKRTKSKDTKMTIVLQRSKISAVPIITQLLRDDVSHFKVVFASMKA